MANFLEQQLADLQISIAEGQKPTKNINSGAPPISKKAQPQVPRSFRLNGPSEPSFTSPLQSSNPDKRTDPSRISPLYSNIPSATSVLPQNPVVENTYINVGKKPSILPNFQKAEPQAPVYSNIPPIPDMPPYPEQPSYANIDDVSNDEFPPAPQDLPPPPSPVSSSYSELRRATQNNDFATYTPPSQTSSTYDSLYEPIRRAGSTMSSNYSSYYGGSSTGGAATSVGASTKPLNSSASSEAEVDALTNLLVQSMDSPTTEAEFFGDCCKCLERVVGEGNGCTAMGQVYHIECFTCTHCDAQLQGKPFYILEGKPYCEAGYLQTLEKCSVCMKPILDRILRATGRPYHPQCFCCVVCGKSLDGVPFTVDATNQIHCIEDFHKKFAPRCCVCLEPIMPEPGEEETVRVVALDRSFHLKCYKCEDCGLLLSSEAEGRGCYPLDDHVLCKSCNAKRVQALTSCMTTDL